MNETTDATAIFAPIWRRKWLILIVGVLVAVGTYGYYKGSRSTYSAKTQIYLGGAAEEKELLNNTLGKTNLTATELADQVELISTTVAEAVHARLRREHNAAAAKGKVKAKAAAGEFITITAEASTAKGAALLANLYAQVYVKRHQANYERSVNTAIASSKRQIRRIEAQAPKTSKAKGGKTAGPSPAATIQVAALDNKISELEADLTVPSAQQIGVAKPGKAEVSAVSPKKNAIFGFAIGIVLAAFVVYVVSRFDGRLRSLQEIDAAFQASY
ncbi:MAG TPA: Wzz/FepE/Etk N-terminal domain-containing protein [Solirubrobacteraceae bacterium]|nr:Wzz/FepE/Etk N-terminal domain-containing protein [Solirubrobacteraceae bacterium]